ncbi:DegT/DnrJ/EryC1/StrS family aminotransferase [Maribacter algicola]|uniref:DegT/DnrJ/EryC1/StrS family aminotransferase n=1 Tax=Meishania litoralis TaxID=3434685 RepID=A0ACC7LJE9_9FLAO
MSGNEQQYVKEAFDTNWIAPLGPNVEAFERDLMQYVQEDSHIAALSSGTGALHLGLILLGVKQDDEVLCQSFTFSASANPITYLGAKPIFIDSEEETWNISPELLEKAIIERIAQGKKPKAIIAVHLYGMPYKVREIREISLKYSIPVLEDSAEALGSSYHGVKCGTFGDVSIFSFNGNKIITTSGGGALCTKDKNMKKRAIFLATQARDEAPHYQHSRVGYNYRMSNVLAGIGRGQMEVLDNRVNARRNNYFYYKEHLGSLDGIGFLEEPKGCYSNRWLTCLTTRSKEQREWVRLALEEENIESRPLWKPMHLQPVFKNSLSFVNGVSAGLFERGLCLPSGSNLSRVDLDRTIEIIKRVIV